MRDSLSSIFGSTNMDACLAQRHSEGLSLALSKPVGHWFVTNRVGWPGTLAVFLEQIKIFRCIYLCVCVWGGGARVPPHATVCRYGSEDNLWGLMETSLEVSETELRSPCWQQPPFPAEPSSGPESMDLLLLVPPLLGCN